MTIICKEVKDNAVLDYKNIILLPCLIQQW